MNEAMPKERILVVDDEEAMRLFLVRTLKRLGYEVDEAADGGEARRMIEERAVDLVLTDLQMPVLDGSALLAWIMARPDPPPVIMMTGYGSIPSAIESLKAGAENYVTKPFEREEIAKTIDQALAGRRLVAENRRLKQLLEEGRRFEQIVGSSGPMRRLYAQIDAVSDREGAVLIEGESGVGKELVARAIHQRSPRRDGPFIAMNLGAVPAGLVAAELFGVRRGAYTGAVRDRLGAAGRADGGTLFLDEIGDAPAEIQSALLRLLEQGESTPIGEAGVERVDIRVIAATNRSLQALIDDGRFRRDLFFRLNVFSLEVPPLRRRKEDIPELVRHFLARHGCEETRVALEVSALLERHEWPGNVRELENAVERMLAHAGGGPLTVELVPREIAAADEKAEETPVTWRDALAVFERGFVEDLLEATRGNVSEAARRAGISRPTLHAKIQQHRIDPDRYR